MIIRDLAAKLARATIAAAISASSRNVIADDVAIFSNDHFSVICLKAEGVRYNDKVDVSRGTAFFVDDSGIAITNSHVIPDAKIFKEVRLTGIVRRNAQQPIEEFSVNLTLIERDEVADVALVRADKPIPSHYVHVVGTSSQESSPIPGTQLTAIGCPIGMGPSLATAKVQNVVDGPNGRWLTEGFFNPGISGSPVFNSIGRVIGIATGAIPSGTIDGSPVNFPYPPGVVTPLSFAESGVVARQKIKLSRGDEIGTSPPLVLSKIFSFSDKFVATSSPAIGGGSGPLASFQGGTGDRNEFAIEKPSPIPVMLPTRIHVINAAPGYEFSSAHIVASKLDKFKLSLPSISTDKKMIFLGYQATDDIKPNEIASIVASIEAPQNKIGTKPRSIQKIFDVNESATSTSDNKERSRVLQLLPEAGYRFVEISFVRLSSRATSEPTMKLLEGGSKLQIGISFDKKKDGDQSAWLIGTILTKQEPVTTR